MKNTKTTEEIMQLLERQKYLSDSLDTLENDLSDSLDEILPNEKCLDYFEDDKEEFNEMLQVFLDIVDNSVLNAEVNNILIQNVENYLHIQKGIYNNIYKFDTEEEAYKVYEKCVNAWDDARDKYFELSEECEEIVQEVGEYL